MMVESLPESDIDTRDYVVTLTLRLTTRVTFSRSSGDGMCPVADIRPSDAIDNAIGSLPHGWLEAAEGEGWEIAYPIDGEAFED